MADDKTAPTPEEKNNKDLPRQEKYPNLLKGCFTGGRPTKYRPEMIQAVDDYIEAVWSGQRGFERFPSLEGLALYIGVNTPDTLVAWANKKEKNPDGTLSKKLARPEFSGAITRLKMVQRLQLQNDGSYMGKSINEKLVKFILNVNHGMTEVNRSELTGKDGKELPAPILGGAAHVPDDNSNK